MQRSGLVCIYKQLGGKSHFFINSYTGNIYFQNYHPIWILLFIIMDYNWRTCQDLQATENPALCYQHPLPSWSHCLIFTVSVWDFGLPWLSFTPSALWWNGSHIGSFYYGGGGWNLLRWLRAQAVRPHEEFTSPALFHHYLRYTYGIPFHRLSSSPNNRQPRHFSCFLREFFLCIKKSPSYSKPLGMLKKP